jgi:hypothetical protein
MEQQMLTNNSNDVPDSALRGMGFALVAFLIFSIHDVNVLKDQCQ